VVKEQSTSNKVIVDIFRLRKEGRKEYGRITFPARLGGGWGLEFGYFTMACEGILGFV